MRGRTSLILPIISLFGIGGCGRMAGGPPIHFINGLVTNGGDGADFKEVPTSSIPRTDTIYVVTHVSWEPVAIDAGTHAVKWNWYSSNGTLVATRQLKLDFDTTPYRFWYRLPAGGLELGHYRVEVAVDGNVMDAHEFDIVP